MTFQKFNISLVLILFCAVQCTASTQNNTNIHFVIEEASFYRLCQSKKILTINGGFPGPTIYAHTGETLSLDVENRGKDNVTMFCCRGVGRHVKSDQVEWIVEAGSTVRKNITISNDEEGTLWWHAMNLWQRATVHGAFIVHPEPDDHANIPIILGEWWKKDVKEVFLDYIDSGRDIKSDAFTINGQPGDLYPCSKDGTFRIVVDTGKKYLLQIVNTAIRDNLYFGIARHNLTVIARDGSPITKQFTTDYVELTSQHSIDCILEANQQPNYYYVVAVTNKNEAYDMNKITTAIIEYQGSYIPSLPPLVHLIPKLSPNYDKSSSRDYVYVILTFVILGLFFCTTFVVWYRQTNRAHIRATVTPM